MIQLRRELVEDEICYYVIVHLYPDFGNLEQACLDFCNKLFDVLGVKLKIQEMEEDPGSVCSL